MPFLQTERAGDSAAGEGFGEVLASGLVGPFPGQALDRVVGDQIHLGVQASGQIRQGFHLGRGVVDSLDEDVFQGDHLALLFEVVAAGLGQFGQRVLAIDRHDLVANRIGGAVQRDRQTELFGFIGQLSDPGGQSAGRDRDLPGTDPSAPRGVQRTEGRHQRVVIGHGFPHAHDHQIVHQPIGGARVARVSGGRGCLLGVPAFHPEDLTDDLPWGEVAFPPVQPAGAEAAAVGAAHLGGDAQRVAIGRLAVEGRVGRNQHAFDERPVLQSPEEFLGAVPGALFAHQAQRAERPDRGQSGSQRSGEIGHGIPGLDAARVQPVQHLFETVGRFVPGRELVPQGGPAFIPDVGQTLGSGRGGVRLKEGHFVGFRRSPVGSSAL